MSSIVIDYRFQSISITDCIDWFLISIPIDWLRVVVYLVVFIPGLHISINTKYQSIKNTYCSFRFLCHPACLEAPVPTVHPVVTAKLSLFPTAFGSMYLTGGLDRDIGRCIGRSIGRYVGRYSVDTQPILNRCSTDARPMLDQYSTDTRPTLDRCLTDARVKCRLTIDRCIDR